MTAEHSLQSGEIKTDEKPKEPADDPVLGEHATPRSKIGP
jgi:hypothetical protein